MSPASSLEFSDFEQYIGVPYKDLGRTPRGWDCWGLVHYLSRVHLFKILPSYSDTYASATEENSVSKAIEENAPFWLRVADGDHQRGDVVVFKIGGTPLHCGFVLEPGFMLHCLEGRDTVWESYATTGWADRIEGVYRWTS